jgi:hypothetical protein
MLHDNPLAVHPNNPTRPLLTAIHGELGIALDKIETLANQPIDARGDILKMLLELFKELLPIILPLLVDKEPTPDAT